MYRTVYRRVAMIVIVCDALRDKIRRSITLVEDPSIDGASEPRSRASNWVH